MSNENSASNVQLNRQSFGNSAISVNNVEKGIEETRISSICKEHKKVIRRIFFAALLLSIVVTVILIIILIPKSSEDLKDHKNFAKFNNDRCNFNNMTNFNDNFTSQNFPWLVRILRKDKNNTSVHSCTGFLIADDIILTAAHCLAEEGDEKISEVLISGSSGDNFNSIIPRRNVKLVPHKDFDENNDETVDIGLIKLSQKLSFTNSFYPACLPFDKQFLSSKFSLIYWSDLNIEDKNIRKTEIVEMHSAKCLEEYKTVLKTVTSDPVTIQFYKNNDQVLFCVEFDTIKSVSGHSGSPATLNGVTATSILIAGGKKLPLPDLYLNIRPHLKWILDHA